MVQRSFLHFVPLRQSALVTGAFCFVIVGLPLYRWRGRTALHRDRRIRPLPKREIDCLN